MEVLSSIVEWLCLAIALWFGLIFMPIQIAKKDGVFLGMLSLTGASVFFMMIYLFSK